MPGESWHPGGVQFVLMDGSVRFLSSNVNQSVVVGLSTRDSGEVIGEY